MHRSTCKRFHVFLICIFFYSFSLSSQSISYETPNDFVVCGSAPFEITVSNTSGSTMQSVTVEVNFTTNTGTGCGVVYMPNTVTGASEGNISDLGMPVFSLNDLAAGATATFTFQAEAPCSVVDCIDNAEFFVNEINLNWTGGSISATTEPPYEINRALLVITQVNAGFMSGSQGDLLFREITIVNTRPGALEGFVFTDMHQGGISISSGQGTVVSMPGSDIFQIELDGSDFTSVGDGDELFELNETIVITEFIRINDCGVDVPSTVSDITVGWGCGGEVCQEVSTIAIIDILPSQKTPNLIWEPITSYGECFCGPEAYQQGMKITNVGTGEAIDLVFDLRNAGTVSYGIDVASVVVDSVGTALDIQPNIGFSTNLNDPCIPTDVDVASSFIITIPALGPSQTVTVFWDIYYCDPECSQPQVEWEYRWSYFKPCPPNPYVEENEYLLVSDIGVQILSNPQIELPDALMDDQAYTVDYEVSYDSFTLINNEFVLTLELPCGLNWVDDNDLILGGQAPINIEQVAGAFSTTIIATYQLPLPANTVSTSYDFIFDCDSLCVEGAVCRDSLASSCDLLPCIPPPPPLIPIDHKATVNKCTAFPLDCNMTHCRSLFMPYECEIDSVCINEPPGYVPISFSADRITYGLPDDDDDRLPDGTGTVDLNLIDTKRIIAGDTIRTRLAGEVVIDKTGTVLPFGQVDMIFSVTAMTLLNSDPFIVPGTGIDEAGANVRIFDASEGLYYDCNNPFPEISTESELVYSYPISEEALPWCIPSGFAFAEGDSVIFEGHYRVVHNLKREGDITPLSGNILVRPDIFVFDNDTTMYDPISCECEAAVFEISGYEYTLLPGIFGLPPCDSSQFIGGSLFRVELSENNFFPFEYRNLVFAEDWRMGLSDQVALCNAKMTFLRYQGGQVIFNNEPLDWTEIGGENVFDFGQYQMPSIDEGFAALFQYVFKMDCDVQGASPMSLTTNLDFLNSLPEDDDPLEFRVNSNSLQALIPNLNITTFNPNLISFNNQLVFDFFLENTPTTVAGQTSEDASNTWMYITTQTGNVTNLQLIDANTGSVIPSVNGVYQLGSFPIGTDSLRFTGINNSCEMENLTIHYGWNCDPFTSQIQTACYRRSFPINITSPAGEIDFLVESPTGCFDLCETLPPYSLEIFNGQLGAVYELIANAQMPPGQTIVPGSSQVEYPTGTGNFFPINDPIFINNTLAQWDLWEISQLLEGLPGINSAPANSITLFFETTTECGFIADAFTLFNIAAELNCGIPSNRVAKPGDPVCINGVTTPYSTNIDVETAAPITCGDEMVFEFSMTASQTLPVGACVIVTLPQGISFVPNSCSSACQANFDCTPTVNGNTYTWTLPEGVASNQIVCFEFNTSGWSAQPCGDGLVIFRTANETQAICAETGQMCSTKVNTGSLLFQYEIERPEFTLENFTISASQTSGDDQVGFSIDAINCGPPNEPPLFLGFFIDTDGDGTPDELVHLETVIATISNCGSETVTGSFTLPPGNLCNLSAHININQCFCSGDSAFVSVPVEYQTDQSLTLCSGETQTVGVAPQSGFTYQWQPADCLLNANEASTDFSCINDTPVPITYQFTLAESDGNVCEINNLIDVTVQPVPGIAFAESPVCAGMDANIAATLGVSYNWQGPDIIDPTIQIQTVSPIMTSTYAVTVTDQFGCSGEDMVTIEVTDLPNVNAGDDIFTCPGVMPQLDATTNPDWDYLWSPAIIGGAPALSDPSTPNPDVITSQDTTFTLTVTDENGCSATDDVFVSQSGALELQPSPDVTICLGAPTTITISGADTYVWSPSGDCNNPECSSITVTPLVETTYTVVGSTFDGCLDSTFITITPTEDDIMTFETLNICEGDMAIIHNMAVNTPGIYVDTTLLAFGCDSISTVTLVVNEVPPTLIIDAFLCEGESFNFNGQILTSDTTLTDTLTSANGCDSIVILSLGFSTIGVEIVGSHSEGPGDSVFLSIQPTTYDSIVWSGGSMLEDCTNSPDCQDVINEDIVFTVTVTDDFGCMAMDTHIVFAIIQCFPDKAEVPNVFTPNNDNINDVFTIVSPDSEEVTSMRIWDRWGNMVYKGTGPWDGTYNGKSAGSDVYIYDIIVGCPVGVEAEEKGLRGDVTLLR